ncbi:hypothetical protein D3C87_1225080 [compost metagenome]
MEFFCQPAEQRLVILGHAFGFHAQVRVIQTTAALGANQRANEFQRIAHGQPVHGFLEGGGLVQLVLFTADHQPGADMFGQHDDGFFVQQALFLRFLQVGREFAVQAFRALIVGGKQLGLYAQQVTPVGGLALVDGEIYPQIREVMAHRAIRGPHGVGRQCGDQRH